MFPNQEFKETQHVRNVRIRKTLQMHSTPSGADPTSEPFKPLRRLAGPGRSPYSEWDIACQGRVITWKTYLSPQTQMALLGLHSLEFLDAGLEAFWEWERPSHSESDHALSTLNRRTSPIPCRIRPLSACGCRRKKSVPRYFPPQYLPLEQSSTNISNELPSSTGRPTHWKSPPLMFEEEVTLLASKATLVARALCRRAVLPNTSLQRRGAA